MNKKREKKNKLKKHNEEKQKIENAKISTYLQDNLYELLTVKSTTELSLDIVQDKCCFIGYDVYISEVNTKLSFYSDRCTDRELRLVGLNSVIFDVDLRIPDKLCSRYGLSIISPLWRVQDSSGSTVRSISLDGCEHSDFSGQASWGHTGDGIYDGVSYHHGGRGDNGKDGKPGHQGRYFFGYGRVFHNIDSLAASVNGGPGQDGQRGGDGGSGGKSWGLLVSYKVARGGDGGDGGLGGKGGYSGHVVLLNSLNELVAMPRLSKTFGRDGGCGSGGDGGSGGVVEYLRGNIYGSEGDYGRSGCQLDRLADKPEHDSIDINGKKVKAQFWKIFEGINVPEYVLCHFSKFLYGVYQGDDANLICNPNFASFGDDVNVETMRSGGEPFNSDL